MLAAQPLVAASALEIHAITADWSRVAGAMNRLSQFCLGAGRVNDGLRPDWQRQLRRMREE